MTRWTLRWAPLCGADVDVVTVAGWAPTLEEALAAAAAAAVAVGR